MNLATVTVGAGVAWVTLLFVAVLGAIILWRMMRGKIDLSRLISEPNGDASMSRLQLLLFTFVIALSLFLIITSSPQPAWPKDDIPPGVLTLLGISASSYLVSKGIQFSNPAGVEDRPPQVTVSPPSPSIVPGGTQQFTADVDRLEDKRITWDVAPSQYGSIDQKGLFTAAKTIPSGGAMVTVKAVSVADSHAIGAATVIIHAAQS